MGGYTVQTRRELLQANLKLVDVLNGMVASAQALLTSVRDM